MPARNRCRSHAQWKPWPALTNAETLRLIAEAENALRVPSNKTVPTVHSRFDLREDFQHLVPAARRTALTRGAHPLWRKTGMLGA